MLGQDKILFSLHLLNDAWDGCRRGLEQEEEEEEESQGVKAIDGGYRTG